MEIEPLDFKVVDIHCHFPVDTDDYLKPYRDGYIAESGQERYDLLVSRAQSTNRQWMDAWRFPSPEAAMSDPDALATRWAAELEPSGVERVAFLTSGGNEVARKLVRDRPECFSAFAHNDPEAPGAAEVLDEALSSGLSGYKLFGPLVHARLSDRRFFPLWEAAESHDAPVLVHFGILGGGGGISDSVNMSPLSLHDAAKAFPKVNFIVPHFGAGYTFELLQLMWACPNVYVDSSGNNEWVRWMPYPLDLQSLFRKFQETVGPERILYGSDSEWFPRGYAIRYLLDQVRAARQVAIHEPDLRMIFRENALRLLGLPA
jgi:predicted TIM-barrel fold metal-dependent hydrolase